MAAAAKCKQQPSASNLKARLQSLGFKHRAPDAELQNRLKTAKEMYPHAVEHERMEFTRSGAAALPLPPRNDLKLQVQLMGL